ncbi:sigma-70 family RNA polymerase sigma factor [Shewanella sp. Isolate11]|uniref:sigma-70 family RNA polymerase sigma factor n=1 Tax=Shewanella sp. Isolate11 TaxID=2908530 RepID=UPI001EFDF215|nr:sigma-70 family RNA polymerase sigma factor [Shewanella sp. Isolate11]MCG9697087.1 sigma-70 family RNA polymerase sigma factor [Shewanella sp. Isolate11]
MQQSVSKSDPNRESAIIASQTESAAREVPTELSHWLNLVAQHRDKQAFTALFQFFAPKIKRYGVQQLSNEAQASELVQETMTNVWRKAHLYHVKKGAATTWVYTVMRNACFDMLRRVKAKNEQNLGDDIWPIDQAQLDSEADVEHFADHLMEKQMLSYVDSLPETQRAVVKGVYYQELSQEQLAQQLGVPIGTIKSRLRLALAKLKLQMEEDNHD